MPSASYYHLISPADIVLSQTDKAATVYDDKAREPVKQVARQSEPIEMLAQISWAKSQSVTFKAGGQGGQSQGAKGYLVFSKRQLAEKGVTLRQGDRVTSIAGIAVDVYLTDEFHAGHFTGVPRHEYWNFADKEPAKTNG